MSFDNLTTTSVTFHSGLKPPPPLATAKFIDTHHNNNSDDKAHHSINNNVSSDHHPHLQKATMPSPRKSVEFILHSPPAKRSKLDSTWTAKQVVDGKFFSATVECFPSLHGRNRGSLHSSVGCHHHAMARISYTLVLLFVYSY